jgi:NADH-quinone oxidoreductase subunit G
MACPGGCSGGGGQPIHAGEELAWERGEYLHKLDRESELRISCENPYIQQLYKDFLGEPLSEKAEHYLHTDQSQWTI